jgi:1-deoxy-D-xylulose-5-phosphate reductoisomerase
MALNFFRRESVPSAGVTGEVEAFLQGQIRFDQIHAVNLDTLEAIVTTVPESLEDLLALDARSRDKAKYVVRRLGD